MRAAAVVLAGGRSSRMGASKAALEWHGSTLLRRVTGVVGRAVDGPVVVVRAPGQDLPPLASGVEVLEDPQEGLGPMQGLAVGLAALSDRADTAFVCSTDLPFLHVAFVRLLLAVQDGDAARPATGDAEPSAGGPDVVLPVARGFPQPLLAVYRTGLAATVATLLAAERLRPAFLFDECTVLRLHDADLLADADLSRLDPDLESVVNVNEPGEYQAARARPAPPVTVERFGALVGPEARGGRAVHAATLAEAAAAARVTLDGHVTAALNGDRTSRDGELPLVAGDVVSFLSADAGG